jgi:GNAT superfamily N-acetyltransferase
VRAERAPAAVAPAASARAAAEILPVADRATLRRFVRLPGRLHAADPAWVEPLEAERLAALSPRSNPYFRHAEAAFWIARRDGRDVGRISAQLDRLAPPDHGRRVGHFGCLDAVDDPGVFRALLGTAEAWLAARGAQAARGPFSLSVNEETGLLVDGFDQPPAMMTGHAPPYAGPHVESAGYRKARDVRGWLTDVPELPDAVRRLLARPLPEGLEIRPLRMAEYRAEVARLVDVFNDAWSANWGFVPMTADEVRDLADRLRPLVRDRFVWFAEMRGEAAGFIVLLPDLNAMIADLGGRLLPFGWARLLWRLKAGRPDRGRVPLMGVRRRHASTALGARIAFELVAAVRREGLARGIGRVELSWVLEDNRGMEHMLRACGARPYKTWRVYEKDLAPEGRR